jgi:hypothetical protein
MSESPPLPPPPPSRPLTCCTDLLYPPGALSLQAVCHEVIVPQHSSSVQKPSPRGGGGPPRGLCPSGCRQSSCDVF